MVNTDVGQLGDLCGVKVRNVEERRLIDPLTLDQHLQNMNQIHARLQVTLVSCDVDHALKDTDGLVEHTLRIRVEVSDREWATVEMSL